MSNLLALNLKLHVDLHGKLRVKTKGDQLNIFAVEGFKIKAAKAKNYLFPILKIEIPKK